MARTRSKVHGTAFRPALLALPLALASTMALAAPKASSNAWDMSVSVSVLNATVLTLGQQNQVQFTPQDLPFADSAGVLSFDSGASALARLTTGAINVETEWLPGTNFQAVGAQARIENLALTAVSVLGGTSLLALSSDVIRATAIVTGSCPAPTQARPSAINAVVDGYIFRNGFDAENLQAGGDTENPGLSVFASGMSEPIVDAPILPEPNTTINVAGILSLVLNEQTLGGDGITSRSVTRNAVHLTVNVLNVISADVILSHAEAAIDCNG
ncbi:MAG TPA: choice-of-anchor P family protein [Rhodanobacteraceae bacterium]|nr:choice-of-anchor P family protein [Rhodanobacteraceae bacterium]